MRTLLILLLPSISLAATCNRANAIFTLRPGAEWNTRGDVIEWIDSRTTRPTDKEINDTIAACIAQQDQDRQAKLQFKSDLNNATKTPAERINALIKYLDLDK